MILQRTYPLWWCAAAAVGGLLLKLRVAAEPNRVTFPGVPRSRLLHPQGLKRRLTAF